MVFHPSIDFSGIHPVAAVAPPGVKGIRHPAPATTPVLLPDLGRVRQGAVAQIGEVPGAWYGRTEKPIKKSGQKYIN